MISPHIEGSTLKKVGSIRDVARETGLSIATVSRVVNGAANVSATTREVVLEACRKLDYVPNPAARALSTRKTRTIAAIIPTIEHSVFAKFVAAIEDTLNIHGYSLVLAISNADLEEELKAARKLVGMGADAFILSGSDHHPDLLGLLSGRGIPCVFTSVWKPQGFPPTIGYDNLELARGAVEFLAAKGHRRLAICHGPLVENDRMRARKQGARAASSSMDVVEFFETEMTVAGGKQAAASMLSSPTNFTAILCFSDVLALGTYFHLQELGLQAPRDISIMGFDNLEWSADIVPPLTTINLPAKRMGRDVANQIVAHLEHKTPIQPICIKGEIIERHSVRALDN